MSVIAKLATDQAIADSLTAGHLAQALSFARKMAVVTSGLDSAQWLIIQAALVSMAASRPPLPVGEGPGVRAKTTQPERILQ